MTIFKGVDYIEKDSLLSEEEKIQRESKWKFISNDKDQDIIVYSAFV
jgi:hypothetical protein